MLTTRLTKKSVCAYEPRRFLARIGLWGDSRGWLRRCAPTLALSQAVYGLLSQVINVSQTWGKLALAAEYCVVLLQMLMTCVKIGCLLANTGPIQEIMTSIDEMRDAHAQDSEVNNIRRHTRAMSDKFARITHNLCASALALIEFTTVLTCYFKHDIIFRRWFPFDSMASPQFELTLLFYGPLSYLDYYTILLFDLLFISLLIELIGEFKVLQHRLENINRSDTFTVRLPGRAVIKKLGNAAVNQYANEKNKQSKKRNYRAAALNSDIRLTKSLNYPWHANKKRREYTQGETSEQRLAACVVQHQKLIRLVSKLQAAFQPALIIHLVCNLCVGLSLTFASLKVNKFDIKMICILAIGFVCVGEFALYCFLCTKLTTEGTLVGEALYACPWWNAEAGFKRSLRIMQLRTSRPLVIRAAAIFPMSMETFTKVMNTAYNVYGLMLTTN